MDCHVTSMLKLYWCIEVILVYRSYIGVLQSSGSRFSWSKGCEEVVEKKGRRKIGPTGD